MDLRTQTLFMGASTAGAPEEYWINVISGTIHFGSGIAVDSQKNVYTTFDSYGGAIPLLKFDKTGSLLFSKTIQTPYSSSVYNKGIAVGVDSSDNVYLHGIAQTTSSISSRRLLVAKFDSTGQNTWMRTYTYYSYLVGGGSSVNSSGDVFIAHSIQNSTADYAMTLKYDSSGNLQISNRFNSANSSGEFLFVEHSVEDSSGNIYTVAQYKQSTHYQPNGLLIKYDSSGNFVWYKTFGTTPFYDTRFRAVAVDSTGNIYCCGSLDNKGLVVKYNSSGTVVWAKVHSLAQVYYGITVDSSNDIYVGGHNNLTGYDGYVTKLNSSGLIQWSNKISNTRLFIYDLVCNNSAIYAASYGYNGSSTQYNNFTFKLPKDGSLTGTYGNFTYSSVTHTVTTPSDTSPTMTRYTFSNQGTSSTPTSGYNINNMSNTNSSTTTL